MFDLAIREVCAAALRARPTAPWLGGGASDVLFYDRAELDHNG